MRKRLTDRFVRTVKATHKQTDYWDESLTGFGLRVSPKGKKTFQVFYRHHRLQRRMTLAPFGVLTLAEARKLAKQKLGEAARGSDPAAIKHANRDAETFGAFAKDYIRHYARPNKKSWTEDQRIIEKELLPWKSRKAKEILRPLLAAAKGEWVFPSVTDRRRPICYATLHYGLRRIAEAADIEEWRSHDLRRTAATHLTANGVSRLTVDKILNHVDRKVIGVYDRYDYSNEKRLALEMWGRKVVAIEAGEELDRNVVAFNAPRR